MTAIENIEHPISEAAGSPGGPQSALPGAPQLTVTERAALLECEAVIRKGRAVFVEVGHALSRIRDSRLYRERYATFEEYCLAEWDISDRYARNLRSATDVVDVLHDKQFMVLPASEGQARPLTKLPREEWSPAWEEVVGTAPAGRVTANHVAAVVQRRMDRLGGQSTVRSPQSTVSDADKVPSSKFQVPSSGGQQSNAGGDAGAPRVIDVGTKDERMRAAYAAALAKLRELQDLIPAGDGGAVHVARAINCVDSFQDHFQTVRRLKENVEKSQGLNPENARRSAEALAGGQQTEGVK